MKKQAEGRIDSLVYPGTYVPLMDDASASKKMRGIIPEKISFPLVNIMELNDSYKVEVAIPGTRREYIRISVDNDIITISLVDEETKHPIKNSFLMHEFEYTCFKTQIKLPEFADPEFISAEYKTGILYMYIPKSSEKITIQHKRVIVY